MFGALGTLAGGFLGGIGLSGLGQYMDYKSADRLAESQRSWQENMSNSAYQRSVADMRAAGLNPMMMYGGGAGGPASTPSGGMGTVGSMSGHLASAVQTRRVASEVKLLEDQADKAKSETAVNEFVKDKVQAETQNMRTNTALTAAHLPEAQASAKLYSSSAGPTIKVVERVLGAIHPALGFGAGYMFRRNSGATGVLRSEQSGRVIGRMKRK